MSLKPEPDQSCDFLKRQAVASKTRNKCETAVYRNPAAQLGKFLDSVDDLTTIYDIYWDAVSRFSNSKHIGARNNNGPFVYQTFREVSSRVDAFGKGLLTILRNPDSKKLYDGLDSNKFIGIFMVNSPEWFITDAACFSYGLCSIPIHESLDTKSLLYVLNHTELTTIVVDTNKLPVVLELSPFPLTLKSIIVNDNKISNEHKILAEQKNVKIYTFKEIEILSNEKDKYSRVKPTADTILTICYTSGTTGDPKGVMISHKNLVSGLAAIKLSVPEHLKFTENDRHLSYVYLINLAAIIAYDGADDFFELDPFRFSNWNLSR